MRQVLAAAETDAWLSLAFVRIANLVDPLPRLFSWEAMARVLAFRWHSRFDLGSSRPAHRLMPH